MVKDELPNQNTPYMVEDELPNQNNASSKPYLNITEELTKTKEIRELREQMPFLGHPKSCEELC